MSNLNGDKTKVGELITKALQEIANLLDKGMAIPINERLESLQID